jgi:hypothetical protein
VGRGIQTGRKEEWNSGIKEGSKRRYRKEVMMKGRQENWEKKRSRKGNGVWADGNLLCGVKKRVEEKRER